MRTRLVFDAQRVPPPQGYQLVRAAGDEPLRMSVAKGGLALVPVDAVEQLELSGLAVRATATLPARSMDVDLAVPGDERLEAPPVRVELVIPEGAVQVTNNIQPADVTVMREPRREVSLSRDPRTGLLTGASIEAGT